MDVTYKKLFKLLIDRNMKKKDLQKLAGISAASIAKMAKGENVSMDILVRVCRALNVETNEVLEILPSSLSREEKE